MSVDLSTTYLGLKLKNPLVASAGPLTGSLDTLHRLEAAGIAAALCLKNSLIPRKLDGRLVRKTMIEQGVPLDKEPSGHWADVKKELKGEFVVVGGDFVGVKTPNGIKTHM